MRNDRVDRESSGFARRFGRVRPYGLSIAIANLLLVPASAPAGDGVVFQVNSTLDQVDAVPGDQSCLTATGTCTLRAAVMEANQLAAAVPWVEIMLPTGTYTLTIPPTGMNGADSGDLNVVDGWVTIYGTAPTTTVIDANGIDRVFTVGSSFPVATTADLRIHRLTLREGSAPGNAGGGVFIFPSSMFWMYESRVTACSSATGGAIYNGNPDEGGELRISRSTIDGNTGTTQGGGIRNNGLTFVANSTVAGNISPDVGGISNGLKATIHVHNSTISGNDTYGLANNENGDVSIISSTIAYNFGAGLVANDGPIQLVDSVVAHNSFGQCAGTIHSFGRNLFSALSCTIVAMGVDGAFGLLTGVLGPLQANGGPTDTHALVAPSNAIDGGSTTAPCGFVFDQRDGPRGTGATCDLGAFEYGALPQGLIFADGFETGDLRFW